MGVEMNFSKSIVKINGKEAPSGNRKFNCEDEESFEKMAERAGFYWVEEGAGQYGNSITYKTVIGSMVFQYYTEYDPDYRGDDR